MAERATYSIAEVAQLLGIGETLCYEQANRGELPVPVIRVGRRIVVSRRALDRLLGLDGDGEGAARERRSHESARRTSSFPRAAR